MKTMILCAIIYALLAALLVNIPVSSTHMAIVLTLASAAWALVMWHEQDSAVPTTYIETGRIPKPIADKHAWPSNFADGYNTAIRDCHAASTGTCTNQV